MFREKREEVEGFILVMVMVMAMIKVVKLMALVLELLRVLNTVVAVLMVVVVMGKSNLVKEKREKGSSFNPEFAPLCPGYTGRGGEEEKPRRKWEKTTLLPNNR